MKKELIFGILIIIILISGARCEDKTVVVIEKEPLCDAPYIECGENECCLDSNNNKICDIEETPVEVPEITEPPAVSFFSEMNNKPAGALSCSSTSISINKACVADFDSANPVVILNFDNAGKTTINDLKIRVLCLTGSKDMASKLAIGRVEPSTISEDITVDLIDNKCVGNAKRLEIYPQIINGWCKDQAILLTPPQEC